jgi:hypothetical protein
MFCLSKVKILDFIQLAKQMMRGMGEEVAMLAWREEMRRQPCEGCHEMTWNIPNQPSQGSEGMRNNRQTMRGERQGEEDQSRIKGGRRIVSNSV